MCIVQGREYTFGLPVSLPVAIFHMSTLHFAAPTTHRPNSCLWRFNTMTSNLRLFLPQARAPPKLLICLPNKHLPDRRWHAGASCGVDPDSAQERRNSGASATISGRPQQAPTRQTKGLGTRVGNLPVLASACPGWVCYAEKTHGDYVLPHISTAKSPQVLTSLKPL